MLNIEKYSEIYAIIHKHDPIGIAWVAEDEYKPEAIEIANRAAILDETKLAIHIGEIFTFWFGPHLNEKNTDKYAEMAKEIKALYA